MAVVVSSVSLSRGFFRVFSLVGFVPFSIVAMSLSAAPDVARKSYPPS